MERHLSNSSAQPPLPLIRADDGTLREELAPSSPAHPPELQPTAQSRSTWQARKTAKNRRCSGSGGGTRAKHRGDMEYSVALDRRIKPGDVGRHAQLTPSPLAGTQRLGQQHRSRCRAMRGEMQWRGSMTAHGEHEGLPSQGPSSAKAAAAVTSSPPLSAVMAMTQPGRRRSVRLCSPTHPEHCNGSVVPTVDQQKAGNNPTRQQSRRTTGSAVNSTDMRSDEPARAGGARSGGEDTVSSQAPAETGIERSVTRTIPSAPPEILPETGAAASLFSNVASSLTRGRSSSLPDVALPMGSDALASASTTSSLLSSCSPTHGKRLPQSRVGYSLTRKKVCAHRCYGTGAAEGDGEPGTDGNLESVAPVRSAHETISDDAEAMRPSCQASAAPRDHSCPGERRSAEGNTCNVEQHQPQPHPSSLHRHPPVHLFLQLPVEPPSPCQERNLKDVVVCCSHTAGGTNRDGCRPASSFTAPLHATRCTDRHDGTSTRKIPSAASRASPSPATTAPSQQEAPVFPTKTAKPITPTLRTGMPVVQHGGCSTSAGAAASLKAVQIIPGLFLGSYADATDTAVLAAHGISLVINCTVECPVTSAMATNPHHVRYVQFSLRDHSDEVIYPFLAPIARVIHEQLHRRDVQLRRTAPHSPPTTAAATFGRTPRRMLLCRKNGIIAHPAAAHVRAAVGGVEDTISPTSTTPPIWSDDGSARTEENGTAGAGLHHSTWVWADQVETEGKEATPSSLSVVGDASPLAMEREREAPPSPSLSGHPSPTFRERAVPGHQVSSDPSSPLLLRPVAAPLATAGDDVKRPDRGCGGDASLPSPVTVVDQRDCGGVLVHCRMGVSRSATMVIAYLILYGCELAQLRDPAPLFERFLERERCIIQNAGGITSFPGNKSVSTLRSTASSRGSSSLASVTPSTSGKHDGLRAPHMLSAHLSPATPISSPISFRRVFCSGDTGSFRSPHLLTSPRNTSLHHGAGYLAGMTGTPVEAASRVCDACYRLRLRKSCSRQSCSYHPLLINKAPPPSLKAEEEEEEEETTAWAVVGTRTGEDTEIGATSGSGIGHSVAGSSGHGGDDDDADDRKPRRSSNDGKNVYDEGKEHCTGVHGLRRDLLLPASLLSPSVPGVSAIDARYAEEPVVAEESEEDADEEQLQYPCLVAAVPPGSMTGPPEMLTPTWVGSRISDVDGKSSLMTPPGQTKGSRQTPLDDGAGRVDGATGESTVASSSRCEDKNTGAVDHGGGAAAVVPAMTYRSAFDMVKRRKIDINPNIGFVLLLRELANSGDSSFSFSTSL